MTDKKNVVFFDIDTQFDFISPKGALYVKGAEKFVKNLKKLVDYARKNKITVVATTDAHIPDDPEFKEFPPHCVFGTPGQEKVDETRQKEPFIIEMGHKGKIPLDRREYLIRKRTYGQTDPFFNNPKADELLNGLKNSKKSKAIVFGIATDYCVKTAVDGLFNRGWQVFLVTDAIKEISKDEAKKLFDGWAKRGVKLVKTKDVI